MTHQNECKMFQGDDQIIVLAFLKLDEMTELGIKGSQCSCIIWRVWGG